MDERRGRLVQELLDQQGQQEQQEELVVVSSQSQTV